MRNIISVLLRKKAIIKSLPPSLIFSGLALLAALLIGMIVGTLKPMYSAAIAGTIVMAIIILLRLDELIVTLIIAASIVVDTYLAVGTYVIALQMSLVLLLVCYFGQSADRPWTKPRSIWLWILFITLTIYPTINGLRLTNAIANYLNLVLGAFTIFWLGNIIAKDISAVRRMFQLLSVLAALIAIHTIIQATTGIFLFGTSHNAVILDKYSNFQIGGTDISRASSFFSNPNGTASFMAISLFLPLGLLMGNKKLWVRLIYLLEMLLILLALMQTYSTGAWTGVFVGLMIFLFLTGNVHHSVRLLILIAVLVVIALVFFPAQVSAQLLHASDQSDRSIHLGSWQTAAQVTEAFPLFGVGLGDQAYLLRSEPYRVPAQTAPTAEPDNSYLQWGATAGIPVMVIFILLQGTTYWFAWCNWQATGPRYRLLLGGGIGALIALSLDSLTVDGWTSPNGYLGWLIAGIIASPLIKPDLHQRSMSLVNKTTEIVHIQAEESKMNRSKKGSLYE
jgi:O-antigen ligase